MWSPVEAWSSEDPDEAEAPEGSGRGTKKIHVLLLPEHEAKRETKKMAAGSTTPSKSRETSNSRAISSAEQNIRKINKEQGKYREGSL